MKVKDIYNYLNELSPFELQEKWDNSGLLVGSMVDEVKEVHISIDLDESLVEQIKPNSLIITHHPLIFSGLKRVNFDSYSTKILKQLIKKDIALISMHTNIDKTHLNKYVINQILGFEVLNTDEFISYANIDMSFEDLVKYVSNKLNLKTTKAVKCSKHIKKVAIVTGAGMSLLSEVQADCFLTGDIKYHDAMEAKARGISLIDIRHYESERFFSELLESLLSEYLKKNELKAIIIASKNPFEFFKQGETVE
ncbi:Nif3-like dinuclear metal center hexameric protein [Arcobacter sp. YIC-80]|uniref:Nif3-like dinuclear metal center hexameric protein n=1 Tax=Arcobacter sp. YIC-80 TaxID=3376683 RepID=UPI00384CB476